MPISACLYPEYTNLGELMETLYELYWHLNPSRDVIGKIYVPLSDELLVSTKYGYNLPKEIPSCFEKEALEGIDLQASNLFEFFSADDDAQWLENINKSGATLVHKEEMMNQVMSGHMKHHIDSKELAKRPAVYMDSCTNEAFIYNIMSLTIEDDKNLAELSAQMLQKQKTLYKDKAYLFGSGPSVSKATDFDFSDGISIICNTMICDEELLEHIQPKYIACVDALLHIGCTKYAHEYRKQLIKVMEKYDAHLLTRVSFYNNFKAHLPAHLADKIIPINSKWGEEMEFNTNLYEQNYVKDTGNVLTMIMLPFASSFAKEINVIGMDGKAPDDKEPLWNYFSKDFLKQYMTSIRDAYPLYYYRDNNAYVQAHEQNVARIVAQIENSGVEVKSLMPSYIKAFAKRITLRVNAS